ncbi:hypothetical protein LIT97_13725 (plasmid) [Enterococcus faecalis]|uniref:hypothetical protein n=1 Tax=Enterococcus faecalis TaxID=1351 RepID=UPI001D0AF12D|nr:hypothetical protein [Enterococcus faecalis]UDM48231.1 hypothetical protein LIT97_13725 [Enterococcus faecalis]
MFVNPILFIIILLIISPLFIGLVQNIIECALFKLLNNKNEKVFNLRNKVIYSILLIVAISFLVIQSVQFYLTNGGYFWLALLTFGIYLLQFIFPYFSLLVFWKPNSFISKIGVGYLAVWSILIFKADNIIYLDEGGVSSRIADHNLKIGAIIIGIALYCLLTVLQTMITKPKFNSFRRKENKRKINYDKYVFPIINRLYTSINRPWIHVSFLVLSSLMPMMLLFFGLFIGTVTTNNLRVLGVLTLVISIISLSNFIYIKSKWINWLRYTIYLVIYLITRGAS